MAGAWCAGFPCLVLRQAPDTLGRPVPVKSSFSCDWVHTGIVLKADAQIFTTIEDNTNDAGDREGNEVCQRVRGYTDKDCIIIS